MKINVLRKMRYQNTFVYVLQFGYVFQYLFSLAGEIYQNHIVLKPKLLPGLKFKLGLSEIPYTTDELEEGEKVILSGALDSIDKAIADGVTSRQTLRKKERDIQDIEYSISQREKQPCTWRAIDTKQGFFYQCLSHGIAVKMEDGVKPVHGVLSPLQPEQVSG